MAGGTTPGDCFRTSTSHQKMLALPTWRISEMIYWAATGGGGCSNTRILMLTLSSAHSGSSNNLLPHQPISTRDLAISALLPSNSDVLATGWILNWVTIQVSLDLIAGVAFALVQLWVTNITPSNAQHSWIYRSSVTSMFHPNRSSSFWCLTFLSQLNATSHSSRLASNYVRSTPSPYQSTARYDHLQMCNSFIILYYIILYIILYILYHIYSLSNIGYPSLVILYVYPITDVVVQVLSIRWINIF